MTVSPTARQQAKPKRRQKSKPRRQLQNETSWSRRQKNGPCSSGLTGLTGPSGGGVWKKATAEMNCVGCES